MSPTAVFLLGLAAVQASANPLGEYAVAVFAVNVARDF